MRTFHLNERDDAEIRDEIFYQFTGKRREGRDLRLAVGTQRPAVEAITPEKKAVRVAPNDPYVVQDGKLITGQNQQSASEYALVLLHAMTDDNPVSAG